MTKSHDSSFEDWDSPSSPSTDAEETRRWLELELQKTRSEASAARLEARAAEIEMLMQRLHRVDPAATSIPGPFPQPNSLAIVTHESDPSSTTHPATAFASWDALRLVQNRTLPKPSLSQPSSSKLSPSKQVSESDSPTLRFDEPHDGMPRPLRVEAQGVEALRMETQGAEVVEVSEEIDSEEDPVPVSETKKVKTWDTDLSETDVSKIDNEPTAKRRGKPAVWLVSTVFHLALILLLGTIGLQTRSPKDQVALSASVASNEEVAMQSFTMESAAVPEPSTDVPEPLPETPTYDISPLGEIKAADFTTDTIADPISSLASSITSSMASSATPSASTLSLKPKSHSRMKFCGVEGGGKHFVYLVDSSKSMKAGFESARRELLMSIDLLTPDQRFYVVFFDTHPDFMRIHDPGKDEPRSVPATSENKAALRRWAMRIRKDRGQAPYQPLKFALGLKADVIFLLSDGEFPEGIPRLLKETNRIENLFGESKPISIVHTIGYHSTEGASIMKRIASQNSGQYRHVPKP